jgi:tRNA threonylcarbamoyl adenosine modification protein YjeE
MAKKKSLAWLDCSEIELIAHLKAWAAQESFRNTVILLEGEMGSGKSTFVRALLEILSPGVRSQGSPTFPLVQEYRAKGQEESYPIYHIDLYRLKNEQELSDSGIESQIEEPGALACIEWPSLFTDFYAYWSSESIQHRKKVIRVKITDEGIEPSLRHYRLHTLGLSLS